jgi:hypothetical protein
MDYGVTVTTGDCRRQSPEKVLGDNRVRKS